MDQALRDLATYLADAAPNVVGETVIAHDELAITTQRATLVKFLTFLRDDSNCQFKVLVDVTAVDFPERDERFEVVYNLLSIALNQRIRIKVMTDEAAPVPSVAAVFSTAAWFEREVWDLFGVLFTDHPDLRRLLTDYGFQGHPLRKDFPLTGYVELRYDAEQKRVVYEPVKLTQEFRTFDFISPWEGMTIDRLPGDEKATEDTAEGDGEGGA